MLCSGCEVFHPVQCFSKDNLRKEAEERLCLGQQGRLYFSSEHSISFKELAGRKACRFLSLHRAAADVDRPTPYISSPLDCQYDVSIGYILNYFWRFDLDRTGSTAETSSTKFRGRVVGFCPHIESNDAKILRALRECDTNKIYDHHKATQVKCHRCDMHVCIMIQSSDPWLPEPASCDRCTVHITRFVGHLGKPRWYTTWTSGVDDRRAMQAQWLMQIDKPSIQDSSFFSRIESPFRSSKLIKARRKRFTADLGPCPQW